MKSVVLAAALLASSQVSAQTVIPSEAYTHPQHLVAVDGDRRLNLFCEGQGSPVVLFDSGLGGTTVIWRYVQGEVAKTTRACSYDRAGYGFSDPATAASDVTATVDDVHRLLKAAGVDAPIVYVGHSIAGLYGVTLQARYPDDVAAEVLVDPSFSDQFTAMTAGLTPALRAAFFQPQAQAVVDERACFDLAKRGALVTPRTKAAKACVSTVGMPYPLDEVLERTQARENGNPAYLAANISEVSSVMPDAQMNSLDKSEVEAAHPSFGDKPLIVLTHSVGFAAPGLTPEQAHSVDAGWKAGHDKLAALSTRGSNTVVPDSHHYIQIDQPKAVIAAVQQAVAAVRTK